MLLTAIGAYTSRIPVQINIAMHCLAIIIIGAFKSLEKMIKNIKKLNIDNKKIKTLEMDSMEWWDVILVPVVGSFTLVGLHYCI